jgi:hypothetical protein
MPTCPNGHQSGSDDWCEVCGHRMAGAVPPPPPPPAPAQPGGYGFPPPTVASPVVTQPGAPGHPNLGAVPNPQPELCPQCRTPREGGAPFCEECRWNFLTNTATSYTPAAPRPSAPAPRFQSPGQSYGAGDSFEYQGSRPSQMNRPAEPIPSGPPFGGAPSGPPPFGGEQSAPGPLGPGGPGTGGFGQGPGAPGAPGQGGFGPGQGPGAPGGFGVPSGPPASPSAPGPAFGADPTRPAGPPPGPIQSPGPGTVGAPQAFQQPAPPAFPQETRRPPAGGGDDDWMLPPPSSAGPYAPPAPPGAGGYGYPQPGASQVPPPPGFPQPSAPQAPQPPATWTATIGPDRDYFMAMMQRSGPEATGLNLPAYSPEQQRTLSGSQITIGRRRHSTGDTPDIDLSVPPEDPGVSHQHAVLVQQPDSSWAVVDQNSTNGTTVNGSEDPIQPFVPVPLQDGDRVHVGAWTTITIRRG